MKTSLDTYLSDPRHRRWAERYTQHTDSNILHFTEEWASVHMPPHSFSTEPLRVMLLDQQGGKLYETWMNCSFDRTERSLPPDWDSERLVMLKHYRYRLHHCTCHRKHDARKAGADTDRVCEGYRFAIERIEFPELSGLILYSETIPAEELEAMIPRAS